MATVANIHGMLPVSVVPSYFIGLDDLMTK
jgi:hypothetical protein